jgi:hypothetical protein
VLKDWLGTAPARFSLQFESLLRVHLSPYGTKEDLLRALEVAREDAEGLLRQAIAIGTEFTEGRHQFQDQVHIRAILFDYLWNFGLNMYLWADRSIEEVAMWPGLDVSCAVQRRGQELIARCLQKAPPSLLE